MGSGFSVAPDLDKAFDLAGGEPDKLLQTYSKEDLARAFFHHVFPVIARKGVFDREGFVFTMDTSDPFVHSCTVSHRLVDALPISPSSRFLLKMFVRRKDLLLADLRCIQHVPPPRTQQSSEPTAFFFPDVFVGLLPEGPLRDLRAPLEALPFPLAASVLEYVYLQNPLEKFTAQKPQLPNQMFPGLGVGRAFMDMVSEAAQKHNRMMLLNQPEDFHNAFLYNSNGMRYLSPQMQAMAELVFEDLKGDIEKKGLAAVAWSVHEGRLMCGEHVVFWPLQDQVLATSDVIRKYLKSIEPLVQQIKSCFANQRPLFKLEEHGKLHLKLKE